MIEGGGAMNGALFKQMFKVNAKGIFNYAIGSAFYVLFMFWLYPGIADNAKAIDDMVKALPEGIANAFGFMSGFSSAEAFISGEFYGLILVILLAIYCIMVSTQLMAKLIDQGSMAYLLSVPTTRGKVAFTQAAVFVIGVLLILGVTTAAGFAGHAWFLSGEESFDSARFLQINVVAFLLFFAIGGLSFMISALSNDEKRAQGLSGFVTFGFFSLDLIGKLSPDVDWLRNFTPFSLYRPGEIIKGTADLGLEMSLLGAIGFVAFVIGIVAFRKRDLHL